MRNSQTHRRRAAARHREDVKGALPSLLKTLIDHLTDRIARSALRRVDRGVHEVVRWTLLRGIFVAAGATVMAGGIGLLLAAAVKGLEALHCPLWAALLSTGVAAMIPTLVGLRWILRPQEEEHFD